MCYNPIVIDPTIIKSFAEIYIPARTLACGIYKFQLTVTMANATNLTSSASAYVKITPSGILANLIPYGTSMITRGYEQDLTFDPGRYSVDLDGNVFSAEVSIHGTPSRELTLPYIYIPFTGLEVRILLSHLRCVQLFEHPGQLAAHR